MIAIDVATLLEPPSIYALAPLCILIWLSLQQIFTSHNLRHIPNAGGPSFPLVSYIGAFRRLANDSQVIQRGYNKYKGRMFKAATMTNWQVVVTEEEAIKEFFSAPERDLSAHEAVAQILQTERTLGHIPNEALFADAVRSHLGAGVASYYPALHDEITAAFANVLPASPDEWTAIRVRDAALDIASRAGNRVFVGLPLCRDEGYNTICKRLTHDVIKEAAAIRMVPDLVKPLAAWLLSSRRARHSAARKYLESVIASTKSRAKGRPGSLLQRFVGMAALENERSVDALATQVLHITNAMVSPISMTFARVLLRLAENTPCANLLRNEVETCTIIEGWTNAALSKMHRIDSFIRETMRLDGSDTLTLFRVAMSDYTFASNGVRIPAGTMLAVPVRAMHQDEAYYANADIFELFRFIQTTEESEDAGARARMGAYLACGYGEHEWGFAETQLKMMLALFVQQYDVKMANDAHQSNDSLNLGAAVLMRRRQVRTL